MESEPERYLGEYRLIEHIADKPDIRRWYAEQTSVGRPVLVDELDTNDAAARAEFIANVRARAAVEHPLIASVYEAVTEGDGCYFAHEYLPGPTLEDRIAAKACLRPLDLAHLIRRIAEAQLHLETAGISTIIPEPRNIHRDDQGLIRLDNIATAGPRCPSQSARDAAALGASLLPLVADSQPGATRVLTLLSWMRGADGKAPLNWPQIRDVAIQIEHQLTQPLSTAPAVATRAASEITAHSKRPLLIGAISVVALILVLAFFLANQRGRKNSTKKAEPTTILIPKSTFTKPDGSKETIPAFHISSHEVTIGEYAEFLERLQTLAEENRHQIFDDKDQPTEKIGHQPDDWENLYPAAKSNKLWKSREVSLDTPVVGIDWWDASAYAEWAKGRLPTVEEWTTALRHECPQPENIPLSSWGPLPDTPKDITPSGLFGMAGSVSEWTCRQIADPANPLGSRKWVIVGGSYLQPNSNAVSRELVDDRSLRRPDLGFRIITDPD